MSVSASTYVLLFGLARKHLLALVLSFSLIFFGAPLVGTPSARAAEGDPVGKLGAIIGKVFIERGGKKIPAQKDMEVMATDKLVTEKKSVVKISFKDGGTFMAFEDSSVTIEEYSLKKNGDKLSLKSAFDIAKGKVRFFVKPGENRQNDATYRTKNAVMGIRGTSGFIDTTKPGQTELVVTTGKVQISNPADPSRSVLVPAEHMSTIKGNAAPETPKRAPAALLRSLNSQARTASGAGGSADAEGGSGEAPAEPSGSEEGEGAPASEDSGQAPAGEEGDGGQAPAGDGQGQTDGDSSSTEGQAAGDASGTDGPAAGEEEPGSSADTGDNAGTESKPSSADRPSPGEQDGSGGEASSGGSEQPSASGNAASEPGSDDRGADRSGGAAPAESARRDGPGNSENTPAAENRQNAQQQGQGQSQRSAGQPAVRKVTVFGQDGAASVSVSDSSVGNLSSTVQAGGVVQARPAQRPPAAAPAELNKATEKVIKDVEKAVNTEKVTDQIQTAVQKAVEQTKPTVQAVKEPVKKSVKIKVVLPQ